MKQKSKFVTKLFATIDGYTGLKSRNDQQALALSLTARDVIKPLIEQHNGEWIHEKNGEIFANFTLPENAVTCAMVMQREMMEHPGMKLRIGIHTGDLKSGIGTSDIIASNIAGSTTPGGICISGKVYASIQHKNEITAEYLKDVKPAGIDEPVSVYTLTAPGLQQPAVNAHEISVTKDKSTKPSIVVLPFVNMSSDPEQEYFCDGITEEIINALAHIEDLKVIARTSAFFFKGKDITIKKIGDELDVGWVLEGSVRKVGNRLRITVQLITVEDQAHIFSKNFDRTLEDYFAIQDEISLSVVEILKGKLLTKEKVRMTQRQAIGIEAYELYLKSWQLCNNYEMQKALPYINELLLIEPDYVPAQMLKASMIAGAGWSGNKAPHDVYPVARTKGLQALKLDENNPEVHSLLSEILVNYYWDFSAALGHLERLMELSPGSSFTHVQWALYYEKTGRMPEAVTRIKKALEVDPLSQLNYGIYLDILYLMREYETFMQVYDIARSQLPDTFTLDLLLYRLYSEMGKHEEAMAYFRSIAVEHLWIKTLPCATMGIAMVRAGETDEARKLIDTWEQEKEQDYFPSRPLADIHFALGDIEKGFYWLNRTAEEREPAMLYVPFDPFYDSFRSDERYKAIMKKIVPLYDKKFR